MCVLTIKLWLIAVNQNKLYIAILNVYLKYDFPLVSNNNDEYKVTK